MLGWKQAETNPFLQGNYEPITDEAAVTGLEVIGELPRELAGTYYRNGPNQVFEPPGRYHVFDGDGMVHAVRLADGKASYVNRWVKTPALEYERSLGKAVFSGVAEFKLPPPDVMQKIGPGKHAVNTSILSHGGKLFALSEGGAPFELDPLTLETRGEHRYGGRMRGAFTAHPRIDAHNGDLLAFGYGPMPPFLRYHVIDAQGSLVHTTEVPVSAPVMMHDFVATERFVVFLDAPAVFDIGSAMQGKDLFVWRPERGTRFGVLPRRAPGAEIRWFEIDSCYVFHFLNGYEEGDRIVLDAARLPHLQNNAGAGDGTEAPAAKLYRYTIDLASGSVRMEQRSDRGLEFPSIDPRVSTRKHRYGYFVHYDGPNRGLDHMPKALRVDFERGTESVYEYGPGLTTGEIVYAKNPGSTAEEDGYLMSFVHDTARDVTELAILRAGDLEQGPIARVRMPRRVPYGFHGAWVPAS